MTTSPEALSKEQIEYYRSQLIFDLPPEMDPGNRALRKGINALCDMALSALRRPELEAAAKPLRMARDELVEVYCGTSTVSASIDAHLAAQAEEKSNDKPCTFCSWNHITKKCDFPNHDRCANRAQAEEQVDCSGSSDGRMVNPLGLRANQGKPESRHEYRKGNPEEVGSSAPAHCNEPVPQTEDQDQRESAGQSAEHADLRQHASDVDQSDSHPIAQAEERRKGGPEKPPFVYRDEQGRRCTRWNDRRKSNAAQQHVDGVRTEDTERVSHAGASLRHAVGAAPPGEERRKGKTVYFPVAKLDSDKNPIPIIGSTGLNIFKVGTLLYVEAEEQGLLGDGPKRRQSDPLAAPPGGLEGEIARLRTGLKWYADQGHITAELWDEWELEEGWLYPPNDGAWMVEPGRVAQAILDGGTINPDPDSELLVIPAALDGGKP